MRTESADPAPADAEFEAALVATVPLLRRLAATLVAAADREDLVQDALARAWTKRAGYDPARGELRSWLAAILVDQARRRWRLRRVRFHVLDEAFRPDEGAPARLDVRAAVSRLPDRQRAAVVLFYYVDLPVSDIAMLLSCSTGTVKSALFDARARLSKELTNYA
ncbi:MAG TPA: RNA polymerase sigma factor [Jatrophihabitans sp.]|nr:RNA polymerase sigma factor [Jatrophihabitans sp.]